MTKRPTRPRNFAIGRAKTFMRPVSIFTSNPAQCLLPLACGNLNRIRCGHQRFGDQGLHRARGCEARSQHEAKVGRAIPAQSLARAASELRSEAHLRRLGRAIRAIVPIRRTLRQDPAREIHQLLEPYLVAHGGDKRAEAVRAWHTPKRLDAPKTYLGWVRAQSPKAGAPKAPPPSQTIERISSSQSGRP